MKFKNFLAAAFSMLVLGTAFANDRPVVNSRTMDTFIKEFNGATNVRWFRSGGFQEARFTFLEQLFIAYFTDEGKLIGTTRDLLLQALPLPVIKSFRRQYPDGFYFSVHEVVNEEGTMYWVKLETGAKIYRVKSDAFGTFLKTEVTKKKSTSNSDSEHR